MSDNTEESPPPAPLDADPREVNARATLDRLIRNSGNGYAAISRLIHRNPAYVQQYIKRGVPRRLAEEDRRILARHFDVSEELLGPPPPAAQRLSPDSAALPDCVEVPCLKPAPGEPAKILVDRAFLHGIADSREPWLAAHRIDDDSMQPALVEGDLVLVDTADRLEHLRDGIYAIRNGNRIFVKRLAMNPVTLRATILSDNSAYTSVAECEPAEIRIVGRIIWYGRCL